jgi:3'(2'), 5'-bisphosphate nucleotidase
MRFKREIEIARRLALEAGALALRERRPGLEVERKEGGEPVTAADRAASALILTGLGGEFSEDAALSEEGVDDLPRRLAAARVWMVDPIDGTLDYIQGRDGFSVMLGLLVEGRPRLGVVHQPATGITYLGVVGEGAWMEAQGGVWPARPARVSTVSDLRQIRLVASKSHRTSAIDRVKSTLGVTDEVNLGSVGLKIGLVAAGERDLYVNPASRSKIWDTCAPEALLHAAGGRITDLHGRPLSYGADLRNQAGIVASNGVLHDAVIEQLRNLFPLPTGGPKGS